MFFFLYAIFSCLWISIELVISTLIIFLKHRKSKDVSRENWKKGYFKYLGSIALFLLAMRTFSSVFFEGIFFTGIPFPRAKYLLDIKLPVLLILTMAAFLSSAATVWILVKFHPVQFGRMITYLVLLSIPIALLYSVFMIIIFSYV